jgi:multiple sugar transport system ATP-binding protein
VRPEDFQISTEERAEWLPARVYITELMGNETFLFLQLGEEKIIARTSADLNVEIDTPVWVSLNEKSLHFFDAVSGMSLL